ncbi:MAG: hypothetical protein HUK16_07470 [Bacteroidales bacterium]|nr:hypothetical protein [Bacteroidales bacterium]
MKKLTAKELLFQFLKKEGIEHENTEFGPRFFIDNWSFLLWLDPDDPYFFRLTLPGIFDVSDENYAEAIMACNAVNLEYKVVKAILYDFSDEDEDDTSNVWICYEQHLDTTPDAHKFVSFSIGAMLTAADAFIQLMTDED